jgi:tetratricopeptide (TPR) repeat protein
MLDKGAARIDRELAQEPAIQATLMDTLGTVYMGLGLYTQSRTLLDRAVALRGSLKGIDPLDLSETMIHRGDLLRLQAEYAAGEKAYRDAIRIESARPQDPRNQLELADSLYGLGKLLELEGRYADADRDLRKALTLQQKLYGASHPAIARTLKNLASEVAESGDLNVAIGLEQRAVAMQRELRGNEPSPDLAEALNDLGVLLEANGDNDGAERFYRESLEMKQRLYGDKHPEVAAGLFAIASVLWDKEDLQGAEALFQRSIAMRRELQGESDPQLGEALFNLASVQYDRGETHEALANMRQVLVIWRKAFPADHPLTARALNVIGFWLTLNREYPEAERDMQEGLAMRRRLFDEHHAEIASSLLTLAILKNAEGRYQEALPLAASAKSIDTAALSADHWRTAVAESAEGAALTGLGRFSEAEARLTHSCGILGKKSGAPVVYRALAQQYLDNLRRHERHRSVAVSASTATLTQRANPYVAPAAPQK